MKWSKLIPAGMGACLVALAPAASRSTVWYVLPDGTGDVPTIQAAMDAAVPGDVVLLGPGTFRDLVSRSLQGNTARSVAFLKSGVVLESSDGPGVTFIDGEDDHHCLVGTTLSSTTEVRGITFLNGRSSGNGGNDIWGGGVLVFSSSALFEGNRFVNCHATGGGAILAYHGLGGTGVTLRDNVFADNTATDLGGGIEIYGSGEHLVEGNTFVRNVADDRGGAVLFNGTTVIVARNIFWTNSSGGGGGAVGCIGGAGPTVTGECNLFWSNSAPGTPNVEGCTIVIGVGGNVSADPLFCDPDAGDFRVDGASPAAPANSGGCGLIGALSPGCGAVPAPVTLTIPEMGAAAGTEVAVPVLLEGTLPAGIASYQGSIAFDPSLLAFDRVEVTGTLSAGRLAFGNEAPAGILNLAVAGSQDVTGEGVLIRLVFDVSPSAMNGQRSALSFQSFAWEEGILPEGLFDGGVTVGTPAEITGSVLYYSGGRPMAGVTIDVTGDLATTELTDSTGGYRIADVWIGVDVVLTPDFRDHDNGAVSSWDASLVLQHLVQLVVLDAQQLVAADVTGDGTVSAGDAAEILRIVVGTGTFPDPLWLFEPATITIDSLPGPLAMQDFEGILRGDVSGNWSPAGSGGALRQGADWVAHGSAEGDGYELTLSLNREGVHAFEGTVRFDPDALVFAELATPASGLWAANVAGGEVRVAGATAVPWSGGEVCAELRFTRGASRSGIRISEVRLDEVPAGERNLLVPAAGFPGTGVAPDLEVRPVPSRGAVDFLVRGVEPGAFRIEVFDVAGRRVRELRPDDPAEAQLVRWDGRDEQGRRAGPGVYFARLTAGDEVRTRRVVIVP